VTAPDTEAPLYDQNTAGSTMSNPRAGYIAKPRSVLLASNYNVWREPFNSQAESFLNVISQVENADVLAPGGASYLTGQRFHPSIPYLIGETMHRVSSQLLNGLGRPGASNMIKTEVNNNYDLFFFMCQFPQELTALNRLKHWRKRSGIAVAYILETWSSMLSSVAANLRLLDQFDHVYVLNGQSISELRRYTKTPVSQLFPATDVALATPMPGTAGRSVDVFSYGRRSDHVHAQLVAMSSKLSDFLYVYDTVSGGSVKHWLDHRLLNASLMKRSKFFIAYNPSDVGGTVIGQSKGEQAPSTRYFEGAAGGAVMLGSRPRSEDFARCFDWPDAVIDVPVDSDIAAVLSELLAQEDRLRTVSHRNTVESLTRHDWSHRWQEVLNQFGLDSSPALHDRQGELRRLSDLPYRWA